MTRYAGLPPIPERIRRLDELAANLWWSWQYSPRKVFRDLDYQLWRTTAHNPVKMLWLVTRERLEQMSRDEEFLNTYDDAVEGLDAAYAAKNTWMSRRFPDVQNTTIAYFSAEFAIHQSLPIYAGGLGVLAGDHCKESSDLGVPLVGVGFMYPQGYFHQTTSPEGWQLEVYERLNWPDVAIEQALKPDGSPCIVAVPLGDRAVLTNVWKVGGRPRQPVPARHRPRGKRAAGSRSLRASLRRRSRNASAAGDHSRHRRRARAARARHRAGGVASERRTRRRSSCCSASTSTSPKA